MSDLGCTVVVLNSLVYYTTRQTCQCPTGSRGSSTAVPPCTAIRFRACPSICGPSQATAAPFSSTSGAARIPSTPIPATPSTNRSRSVDDLKTARSRLSSFISQAYHPRRAKNKSRAKSARFTTITSGHWRVSGQPQACGTSSPPVFTYYQNFRDSLKAPSAWVLVSMCIASHPWHLVKYAPLFDCRTMNL